MSDLLEDSPVIAALAQVLRDKLARGEIVIPLLQTVMDNLAPDWRDRPAVTPAELHEGRCGICMGKIEPGEPTREVPRGSGLAHVICPDWPPAAERCALYSGRDCPGSCRGVGFCVRVDYPFNDRYESET